MRWLDGITNSVDKNLSKTQKTVEDRGAWHAEVHGGSKIRIQLSDSTTPNEKVAMTAKLSFHKCAAGFHQAILNPQA